MGATSEKAILEVAAPDFRQFFRLAMACGRRPDELANIRKDEVVLTPVGLGLKLWHHKNFAKTNRPESVWLTPEMQKLVRELLDDATNDTEFLLVRRIRGRGVGKWTPNEVAVAMKKARKKAKVSDEITCYHCRHAYITRSLLAGVPTAIIARQCGNSLATISKYYDQSDKFAAEIMYEAVCRTNKVVKTEVAAS